MWAYVQVPMDTGSCKLHGMGVGKQTRILCKSSVCIK